MATEIPFNRSFEIEPDRVYALSPLLRRITAKNPSNFTFRGTNTYIVGQGRVAVVDPGPDRPEHTEAILAALAGETVSHILVTHTHMDHSPGVPALKARTGAPVYGYGPHGVGVPGDWPWPAPEGGDLNFRPDVRIGDGALVRGDGWTLEAVFTPGHISNHLCFQLREENVLLSGDHVMGWSTSVISPPDGNMTDYMASLAKLLGRGERRYWPGHGGPVEDPRPFVKAFIAHRHDRERQILDCLAAGPKTIKEMVPIMYADVAPALHGAAGRSVLAHLIHMHGGGRVAAEGGRAGPDTIYRLP
ncbi:MAG: MBL fold metallo-hydrolase [Alphaproteobacteria bacterium]|nr:MBL fold metallo-hydrolase [Alphaproteobacteria bacterium]